MCILHVQALHHYSIEYVLILLLKFLENLRQQFCWWIATAYDLFLSWKYTYKYKYSVCKLPLKAEYWMHSVHESWPSCCQDSHSIYENVSSNRWCISNSRNYFNLENWKAIKVADETCAWFNTLPQSVCHSKCFYHRNRRVRRFFFRCRIRHLLVKKKWNHLIAL